MTSAHGLSLAIGGLFSGILAGFLGIGGGTVLVPFLVALGYIPIQAVATSTLAILITSFSGSIQNWRMGYFDFNRVIYLGFPALLTAPIGIYLASYLPAFLLLTAFGMLLISNIYLFDLRKRLTINNKNNKSQKINPLLSQLVTGGAAGILAGLFGVGGGIIMVPLQILLLKETVKVAIQTSLGVIVIASFSACIGHVINGNVFFIEGTILGLGGFLGAQISTRILPKLPDKLVSLAFRSMLGVLAIYVFFQAWKSYSSS